MINRILFKDYYTQKTNELISENNKEILKEIKNLDIERIKTLTEMKNTLEWKIKSHFDRNDLNMNLLSEVIGKLKNHDPFYISVFNKATKRQNIGEKTQISFLRDIVGLDIKSLPNQNRSKNAITITDGKTESKTIDAIINGKYLTFLKTGEGNDGGFQKNVWQEAEGFVNLAKHKFNKNKKFILVIHVFPFKGQEQGINPLDKYKKLESKNVKIFDCDTINKKDI